MDRLVWEGFREMVEMFNPIWCAGVVVKKTSSHILVRSGTIFWAITVLTLLHSPLKSPDPRPK